MLGHVVEECFIRQLHYIQLPPHIFHVSRMFMFVRYLIVYLPQCNVWNEHAKPHIHVRENHYDKICGNNLPYGLVPRKPMHTTVKATST